MSNKSVKATKSVNKMNRAIAAVLRATADRNLPAVRVVGIVTGVAQDHGLDPEDLFHECRQMLLMQRDSE